MLTLWNCDLRGVIKYICIFAVPPVTVNTESSPPECVSSDSLPDLTKPTIQPSPKKEIRKRGISSAHNTPNPSLMQTEDCCVAQWPSGSWTDPIVVESEEYPPSNKKKTLKKTKTVSLPTDVSQTSSEKVKVTQKSISTNLNVHSSFPTSSPLQKSPHDMNSPHSQYMYSPYGSFYMPHPSMPPFYGNVPMSSNDPSMQDPQHPFSTGFYPLYPSPYVSQQQPSPYGRSPMISPYNMQEGLNVGNVNRANIRTDVASVKSMPKTSTVSKPPSQTKEMATFTQAVGKKIKSEFGMEGVKPLCKPPSNTVVNTSVSVLNTCTPTLVSKTSTPMPKAPSTDTKNSTIITESASSVKKTSSLMATITSPAVNQTFVVAKTTHSTVKTPTTATQSVSTNMKISERNVQIPSQPSLPLPNPPRRSLIPTSVVVTQSAAGVAKPSVPICVTTKSNSGVLQSQDKLLKLKKEDPKNTTHIHIKGKEEVAKQNVVADITSKPHLPYNECEEKTEETPPVQMPSTKGPINSENSSVASGTSASHEDAGIKENALFVLRERNPRKVSASQITDLMNRHERTFDRLTDVVHNLAVVQDKISTCE